MASRRWKRRATRGPEPRPNHQPPSTAHTHAPDALVPATNHLAATQSTVERITLELAVEDCAVRKPPDVVDPYPARASRRRAGPHIQFLYVKTRRRELEVREIDAELGSELDLRGVRGWKRTRGRATGACPE